jgi:hypothetical protein
MKGYIKPFLFLLPAFLLHTYARRFYEKFPTEIRDMDFQWRVSFCFARPCLCSKTEMAFADVLREKRSGIRVLVRRCGIRPHCWWC